MAVLVVFVVLAAWQMWRVSRPWHNEESYFGVHVSNASGDTLHCAWWADAAFAAWCPVLGLEKGAPLGETYGEIPLFGMGADHESLDWSGERMLVRVMVTSGHVYQTAIEPSPDGHLQLRVDPDGRVTARAGTTSRWGWISWDSWRDLEVPD